MTRNPSRAFNFPPPQRSALRPGEIVVDLFAGGGGASEALKQAIGKDPELAYNHDADAIGMHAANHPLTAHHQEDIWHADPARDVAGRPVGWLHASPDCTHFSQAKGGQPRNRKIRSLTWVVLKWAVRLARVGCAPRIISLENVRQILTWGPLVAKRCRKTGCVLKLDGTTAANGERVPVEQQQLIPDKRHTGRTWRHFVAALRAAGYAVDWRLLTACDYGAGTSRERLFLLARRDGEPIRWPTRTHGPSTARPFITAADCLDFTLSCPSIFDRPRPLADATLRRIARGVMRHVVESAEPYFITEFANASAGRIWSADEPLRTQCAGVKHALVAAFLEQANGGGPNGNPARARSAREPVSSITATGSQQRLVTCTLSPESEAGALRAAAMLINYYGNGTALDLRDPLATITTRDRLALVTVMVRGTPHVIVDIGLRMLRPHELYRAQGFPIDYIHTHTANGRQLTISAQVRMVGNSVSPPPLRALVAENLDRGQTLAT